MSPEERFKVCMSCPFISTKSKFGVCRQCGCLVYLKTKIINTKCPKGKW